MNPHPSIIERAFQIARSGAVKDMQALRARLKKEGYIGSQIDGFPTLSKQLRLLMAAAQEQPAGKSQRVSE
jgi:hypothetical protein